MPTGLVNSAGLRANVGGVFPPFTAYAQAMSPQLSGIIDKGLISYGSLGFSSRVASPATMWSFTTLAAHKVQHVDIVQGAETTWVGAGGSAAMPVTPIRCAITDAAGNLLGVAYQSWPVITTQTTRVKWTFAPAVAITPGNTYWLVFDMLENYPILTGTAKDDNTPEFTVVISDTQSPTGNPGKLSFTNRIQIFVTGWPSQSGSTSAAQADFMHNVTLPQLIANTAVLPSWMTRQFGAVTPRNFAWEMYGT